MTWQTSKYPPTTDPCPHCGKRVGSNFDIHEAIIHPEQRAKPQEYLDWLEIQRAQAKKKKKKQ